MAKSSGRRSALARWMTRPDHPLTTRVAVNRMWQKHFGKGIVETSGDYGFMGDTPTHPQLLDWLATELPRRGWSQKAMHRLMVTSASYRQVSRFEDDLNENAGTATGNTSLSRYGCSASKYAFAEYARPMK